MIVIPEVLSDRQRSVCDPESRTRRLVHLPEDEHRILQQALLLHLQVDFVCLPGSFADTGKHRNAPLVRDGSLHQLHHEHGLADARPAEEPEFATPGHRDEEI